MGNRRDANNRRDVYMRDSMYIGDNLARRNADRVVHSVPGPETHKLHPKAARRRKAGIKALDVAAVCFAAAIIIGALTLTVGTISRTNTLNNEISDINIEINEMRALNDSREYAIDSSIDLNYVSQTAANELGMVRSSAGQIVTYEVQNSEYIQQVAEIPEY